MREIEIFVNSETDRVISQNASTSKEFTALLNNNKEIQIYPNERRCNIKLNQVEIPNVLYNFPFSQNRLNIILYDASLNATSMEFVELDPNRVYNTPTDVINYMNNELTAHSNSIMNDLVLSFSDLTKKVTLTNNSSNHVRIVSSFRYREEDGDGVGTGFNTIVDRIGMCELYKGTTIAPSASLTGNGTIRMLYTQCYYLTLKNLASSYEQSIVPSAFSSDRILGRITAQNYGTLSQLSFASQVSFNIPANTTISYLTFALLDQELQIVDLKNHPITFSVILTIEE
jgi:hypothetical protein